ncbi:MAG: hypothetical protein JGK30_17425 [Microcoleus sp. PH2017_40_RAT_O_B]|uniref:hypothetical protein n=1 Tax=unclassified Microcoleus TaxID=2642155 RepID=UPI001D393708|nr:MULTISPECIES: hypothetical protein [unclassified Microcoleus]MCC3573799.1 hypothetical protein [Microcoleus sp. PH2017_34_RAT_O_A]MCC3611208.1 hypothetical protein [Microcoleus sp. PH2017_40_RAT_O_B]
MNFTSTLLTIDLAVVSCILGLMVLVWNSLTEIQKGAVAVAKHQTEIEKTLEFHEKRLDSVEQWIAGNSGLRER